MIRRLLVLVMMASALAACDRSARVEKAHEAAREAYEAAETSEEKVAVVRDFLASYPESEYTLRMVRQGAYHLSYKLDQPAEADALVVEVLDRVRGDELRRDLLLARLGPLGKLGRGEELTTVAGEIAALGEFDFDEHESVIDAASEAGAWNLALAHADAALPLCTAEAFRAANPERQMTDTEVDRRVRGQLAGTLAAKGWALTNLERFDQALATFDEAKGHDLGSFTGDSDSHLGAYEGRTLVRMGRSGDAVGVLAPYVLFGRDEDALTALREAYLAGGGEDAAFDEFLWKTRLELAPAVPDFTLAGYDGASRSFADLKGSEVTLLAFWFPT